MLRLKAMLVLGLLVLLSTVGFTQAQTTSDRLPEVAAAQQDLAQRLQVDPARLQLERVETRTWRDASLDCPQPGRDYPQVLTPGYYILLRNGADVYEYHADLRGRVAYSSRNIISPHEVRPVADDARMLLAAHMGCAPASVTSVDVPFSDFVSNPIGDTYVPDWERINRHQPGELPLMQCGGQQYAMTDALIQRNVSFVTEVEPVGGECYRMAYLAPAQKLDGFNLWDLAVRDSVTDESRVLVCNVSDFCVSPGCERVLFLRRIAGGMQLGALDQGQGPVQLAQGPDFRALSWDATGTRYTAWAREGERAAWRLVVGTIPNPPKVQVFPASLQWEGLPQPPFWQGDMMAFTFDGGRTPRSFLLNGATGEARALPDGRFAGWLETPGEYLRISGNQLIHDSIATDYRFAVVANIPGIAWARPLPGCLAYVALTQEGARLKLWTAPVAGQRAPRLVSELDGALVHGQVSDHGTMVLIQNLCQVAANRQECRVTLVSLQDGQQESLTGMCPRAQLLPAQQAVSFPVPAQ